MAVCAGTKRNGEPCAADPMPGSRYCWHHDPARAEERRRNASRAASAKHSSVARELRDLRDLIWEVLELTVSERLPATVRKRLAEVIQLLQCYLRAVELEMRAIEEPLRSDLDVKGLRARVLRRIEVLEEQERERERLLAKLVPVMEAWGQDAEAVKAALSS